MVDSKDPMGLINLLESGDLKTSEEVKQLIKNELQSGAHSVHDILMYIEGGYLLKKFTEK